MLSQGPLESHIATQWVHLWKYVLNVNILYDVCCGGKQLEITLLEIQR